MASRNSQSLASASTAPATSDVGKAEQLPDDIIDVTSAKQLKETMKQRFAAIGLTNLKK